MNAAVAGGDLNYAQAERDGVEVGDHAAGLAHQEHAGGHVPRLEIEFPEGVEAAAGDVAEVEGRGAVAADAVREQRELMPAT